MRVVGIVEVKVSSTGSNTGRSSSISAVVVLVLVAVVCGSSLSISAGSGSLDTPDMYSHSEVKYTPDSIDMQRHPRPPDEISRLVTLVEAEVGISLHLPLYSVSYIRILVRRQA